MIPLIISILLGILTFQFNIEPEWKFITSLFIFFFSLFLMTRIVYLTTPNIKPLILAYEINKDKLQILNTDKPKYFLNVNIQEKLTSISFNTKKLKIIYNDTLNYRLILKLEKKQYPSEWWYILPKAWWDKFNSWNVISAKLILKK